MSLAELDLSPSPLEVRRRDAEKRDDFIDLSSSNPTRHGLVFPPEVLRELADEYWPRRRYEPHPRGHPSAREAIVQYYARRNPPLDVSPEHVFITASTSESYSLLFTLLTGPGDNVLAPIPSYPLFSHLAAMHHIELLHYGLEYSTAETRAPVDANPTGPMAAALYAVQWQLHAEAFSSQRDSRSRALLLISPHNPTGHVVRESMRGLVDLRLPVIADEVFCEFPFAAGSVPPVGALHPEATVFHLNGISKMFALPDLKLGWIALSGPQANEYIDRLELLNDTLLSANALTQFMLPALFERGMAFVRHMRERVQSNLLLALRHLHDIDWLRVAPPLGGTYLFPEVLGCHDEDLLLEEMLDAGLFAHPGYFYDEERGCFLMISALLETPKLVEGLVRLKRVLDVA